MWFCEVERHHARDLWATPVMFSRSICACDYLCECDWLVFGKVIGIFACEHSTVATIHLLWDLLKAEGKKKDYIGHSMMQIQNYLYSFDRLLLLIDLIWFVFILHFRCTPAPTLRLKC